MEDSVQNFTQNSTLILAKSQYSKHDLVIHHFFNYVLFRYNLIHLRMMT